DDRCLCSCVVQRANSSKPRLASGNRAHSTGNAPGHSRTMLSDTVVQYGPMKAYDPTSEVLQICRDLVRIDTTNYGDGSGPGERKAAEYVAASLDEVGITSQIMESAPGRASLIARWGEDAPGSPL